MSVLIPTYNRNCYLLAKILSQQCSAISGMDWEVVVIDDGSTDASAKASNRWLSQIEGVRFVEAPQNVGRSRIRNRAIDEARGKWLVFLDDDVMPANERFMEKYVKMAQRDKWDVVCGGVNALHRKEDESSLRWIYDAYAEEQLTLEKRRVQPFACFTTANFMARRSVFDTIRFDESLSQYGYEDALFGILLEKHKVRLRHTNNPVEHLGIEPNDVYVRKTEQALENLYRLGEPMTSRARVSVAAGNLRRKRLLWLVKVWHCLFGKMERRLLCSKYPSVHVLQLYKLGYYSQLKESRE